MEAKITDRMSTNLASTIFTSTIIHNIDTESLPIAVSLDILLLGPILWANVQKPGRK